MKQYTAIFTDHICTYTGMKKRKVEKIIEARNEKAALNKALKMEYTRPKHMRLFEDLVQRRKKNEAEGIEKR